MVDSWFWGSFAVVISVVAVIAVGTWAIARDMRRSGGGGGVHANPLGAMDEVFHPAAHRAKEELRHVDEMTEVVPAPTGDDPSGSAMQLSRGPDGSIRTARITRRR
ncbi:hypothetical protein [Nocardioides alcanivorans]|uniref:hypothetical protein n=1 Tax=Nocardioides alcanivorans TaxID=2897352 RepID=UPI001F43A33E|nr:hypothetical protein [Nocardioides alcanivorans]